MRNFTGYTCVIQYNTDNKLSGVPQDMPGYLIHKLMLHLTNDTRKDIDTITVRGVLLEPSNYKTQLLIMGIQP